MDPELVLQRRWRHCRLSSLGRVVQSQRWFSLQGFLVTSQGQKITFRSFVVSSRAYSIFTYIFLSYKNQWAGFTFSPCLLEINPWPVLCRINKIPRWVSFETRFSTLRSVAWVCDCFYVLVSLLDVRFTLMSDSLASPRDTCGIWCSSLNIFNDTTQHNINGE